MRVMEGGPSDVDGFLSSDVPVATGRALFGAEMVGHMSYSSHRQRFQERG